jgi:hypothetical protein
MNVYLEPSPGRTTFSTLNSKDKQDRIGTWHGSLATGMNNECAVLPGDYVTTSFSRTPLKNTQRDAGHTRNARLSPLNILLAIAVAITANLFFLSRLGSLQRAWLAMKAERQQLAGKDEMPKLSQVSISDIIDGLEARRFTSLGLVEAGLSALPDELVADSSADIPSAHQSGQSQSTCGD